MSEAVAAWGVGTALLVVVMTLAWFVQRRTGQGGWIDALWVFGLAGAAAVGALWPLEENGSRRMLVAGLIALWGVRLGAHLAARAARGTPDPRYEALKARWGQQAQARMFGFLMLQAGAGAVLLAGPVVAARHPAAGLTAQDLIGAALLLGALTGEAIADRQLARFKADPANAGRICDRGLWAWSRHPNYFFEWLAWCAWPVMAIDMTGGWLWGWLALIAPAYLYWLLTRVSGVPPLEEHMRRTRPKAFADYARRTSVFFLRPPRA